MSENITQPLSKLLISIFILFSALLLFRMSVNLTTHYKTYFGNYYRIGIIPWSDAYGWVSGAEQILEGRQLSDFPARRPLYPLFLANLFSAMGMRYSPAIFVQITMMCLAVILGYLMLQNIRERLAVILFLIFLSLWHPTLPSMFMTENLGVFILIISFSLIWKGIRSETRSDIFAGYFLLGLSQAVRPYSLLCLATVPFIAFFISDTRRNKIIYFLSLLFFVSLGYSLHGLASVIFNQQGTASNFALTLYGQVSGGKGWTAAYYDPAVVAYIRNNTVSPDELNAFIYKRTLEIFLETPSLFFVGVISAYKFYFVNLPYVFSAPAKFFILLFPLFLVCEKKFTFAHLFFKIKSKPLCWFCLPLAVIRYEYFWTIFLAAGFIQTVRYHKQELSRFLLLYFAGILLSLPLIGSDGGFRVTISSDIFVFLVAAVGFHRFLEDIPDEKISDPIYDRHRFLKICGIPLFVFLILICLPYLIKMKNASDKATVNFPVPEGPQIAKILNLETVPAGPAELADLKKKWPEPSYEKINNTPAYVRYKYSVRDSVFFDADEGGDISDPDKWPAALTVPKFPRTVYIRHWTIFPYITPQQLRRFDNREIIVQGRLIARPLRWRNNTGYVIIANYIGCLNQAGNLEWITVSEL